MPTPEQLRTRLIKKLRELFQLDQPDLDFGFYRIMHAKAAQVSEFIEKDLLQTVENAFGASDGTKQSVLKAEYEKAVETARSYGAPDPENTPQVKEAKARYLAALQDASGQADIYDHLYRFFERYYDEGDFISRRYYARETEGRAAPFAIPYSGEEVKLHWANSDQYYIKTTEYFSNFTFDLSQAAKVQIEKNRKEKATGSGDLFRDAEGISEGLRAQFRIVEATEGEHGNVKASDTTKRFFISNKENPVEMSETGELIINFEYRPDPEKSGQESKWREKKNEEAVSLILSALQTMAKDESRAALYLSLLSVPAPTESDKKRILLARYINQYTARNTMDYFIHKDLGAFLHRELDFYIKNEVMRLDDIENADFPAVESYLSKIKVLRQIAGKLIDFLAQLEDFQKKLWLKKKFVVETNYCITLDRVPEELYPAIAENQLQWRQWKELGMVEDGKNDLFGQNKAGTIEYLTAHPYLTADTSLFEGKFKEALLSAIDNLNNNLNGLLIQADNFQALNFIQERFRGTVKAIYIDPPYNTDASPIIYKNGYRHASWATLFANRMLIAEQFLPIDGMVCVAIDDFEYPQHFYLMEDEIGFHHAGTAVVRSKPQGRPTTSGFSANHEYAVFWSRVENPVLGRLPRKNSKAERYPYSDEKGVYSWANFRKSGTDSDRVDRKKSFYPVYVQGQMARVPEMKWNQETESWYILSKTSGSEVAVWPIDQNGNEKVWTCSAIRLRGELSDLKIIRAEDGTIEIQKKYRPNQDGSLPGTWWDSAEYSASESGTKVLKDLFKAKDFDFPKSINLVIDNLRVLRIDGEALVLDFFAGSATTAHATISLNRQDRGARKYILIEQADYFDTVLKPRIQKVVYSADWKEGKPTAPQTGISHCFKYLRLESYEDTLNNLRFDDNPLRTKAVSANTSLKEDYMLHYLLDVETKGSQSLLNIDAFNDPTSYTLKVKRPGSDEYVTKTVDLLETFNYLIGLRVTHTAAPQTFAAAFTRLHDPELPDEQHTKLVLDGKLKQDAAGPWWFRKVEGWVPADPSNPNNGSKEKVLIVWRKLTGNVEEDNLVLDEWFEKNRISTRDFEFDTIYVNGSNNLPNLLKEGDHWKVRLIEEEFMKRMWGADQ